MIDGGESSPYAEDEFFPEAVKEPLFNHLEETCQLMDDLQKYRSNLSPVRLYRQLIASKALPQHVVGNILKLRSHRWTSVPSRYTRPRPAPTDNVGAGAMHAVLKRCLYPATEKKRRPRQVTRVLLKNAVVERNKIHIKRNSSVAASPELRNVHHHDNAREKAAADMTRVGKKEYALRVRA